MLVDEYAMVVDREELECRGMDHEDEEEDEGMDGLLI